MNYSNHRWEIGVTSATHGGKSLLSPTSGESGGGARQRSSVGYRDEQQQLVQSHQQHSHSEQAPNHYRTIISNSRIHILENASLVIRDVGKQDQGFYLCQAANNFGSLSALIKLTVNGEYSVT